ncbi:MAG: ribonuclease HII [Candidatus Omnitrophota bacterium]
MRGMDHFERISEKAGKEFIIGVDEAGRGPLAGPVVAAAVCLRGKVFHNRIDDSKRLSASQRNAAYQEIILNSFFGIGIVNEKVIDRVNILVATKRAMEQAIAKVLERRGNIRPDAIHVLIDGPITLNVGFSATSIIKGDQKSLSIAAASILAKVTRDRIMDIYDKIFPVYGFAQHKGYGTLKHRMAIERFGRSSIHRMSFCGVKDKPEGKSLSG